MKGKVRNFYAGGNTAKGFFSLYDSALEGLERIYSLKGGPGTGKSSLMKAIGEEMAGKGLSIEYLHCASDNNSIDGVIIPSCKVAIVDGTIPHIIEPQAPGVIEEYVNLGVAWESQKLAQHKEKILELTGEISNKFDHAYKTFAEGLRRHDDIEKIYINNMNFDKANELTEELIELFYGDNEVGKKSKVRHSFLGAATPNGPVDFIQNLTEETRKRYFIKGRAGSGKSTMLKKIAREAENRGFDVEIYHCGFDPHSLDMVILPEQSIAIFDSTAPHEYFPNRETDEIVDMYTRCIAPGTDEKFAKEIQKTTDGYKTKMVEGTTLLAEAKVLHDELEKYYIEAIDFNKVEDIKQTILREIELLLK